MIFWNSWFPIDTNGHKSPSSPLRLNIIWKWVQLRPDPAMFTAVVIFITPLAIRGCILHRFFNFALLKFSWIRWLFYWKECFRKFSGDISDCTKIFQILRPPTPVPKYWKKNYYKKSSVSNKYQLRWAKIFKMKYM